MPDSFSKDSERFDRQVSTTSPSRSLLDEVLTSHFRLEDCSSTLLSGGFSNFNFLIESPEKKRSVLRCVPEGHHCLQTELSVLRRVKSQNIPVPQVLNYTTKAQFHFALLEWCEGATLASLLQEPDSRALQDQGEAIFYGVGLTLARIHSIPCTHAGFFGSQGIVESPWTSWSCALREYIEECLAGIAGTRLGPHECSRWNYLYESHWRLLEDSSLEPCLVHSDFNAKNILIRTEPSPTTQTALVSAVIDWEFALSAHPGFDLGNFLRFAREDYRPEFTSAFLNGYTDAGGILEPQWSTLAMLIDTASMLNFLNRNEQYPKTFQTARKVLAHYAHCLETEVAHFSL